MPFFSRRFKRDSVYSGSKLGLFVWAYATSAAANKKTGHDEADSQVTQVARL